MLSPQEIAGKDDWKKLDWFEVKDYLDKKYSNLEGLDLRDAEQLIDFIGIEKEYRAQKGKTTYCPNSLLGLVGAIGKAQSDGLTGFGRLAGIHAYRRASEFCTDDVSNKVMIRNLEPYMQDFYNKNKNVIDSQSPTVRDFLKDGYSQNNFNNSQIPTTKKVDAKAVENENHTIEFEGKNLLGKRTFIARYDNKTGEYVFKMPEGEYTNKPSRIQKSLGNAPKDLLKMFSELHSNICIKARNDKMNLENLGNQNGPILNILRQSSNKAK